MKKELFMPPPVTGSTHLTGLSGCDRALKQKAPLAGGATFWSGDAIGRHGVFGIRGFTA